MEQYYVLKKKSDEYFYGFEEGVGIPKFGEFNLSLLYTFNDVNSAQQCEKILEAQGHLDVLVVELVISLRPVEE